MTLHTSACPLDCPDTCSLEVEVRDGKIVRIDGTEKNPTTRGFICGKVRRMSRHVYGEERLRHPLVRSGAKGSGEFRQTTWDAALDLVAQRLRALSDAGRGEAILPISYGGSNGFLTQDTTDARLFFRLGASRLDRTVCAAPSKAAAAGLYGRMPGVAYTDFVHARLIVVWGCNPSATGIHQVPFIREAQAAGAKLIVVDPRKIPLSRQADLHIQLRPGTDLPVALSMIRFLFAEGHADESFLAEHTSGASELRSAAEPWTFEEAARLAGVPAELLESFARLYAESSPALIRCGWGPERNRNGGSATAAILALPAVGGKFGVRGGGYTASNSGAFALESLAAAHEPVPETRRINMSRIGRLLRDREVGKIDLVFVYNCNPLATLPHQEAVREGLGREDLFTVVFDQVMTDTARLADVVLPATTFLEHRELKRGYGPALVTDIFPVIEPVGEARPNADVFLELCRRTGVDRPNDPNTLDEQREAILRSSGRHASLSSELASSGQAFPEGGFAPVPFVDSFPRTTDKKAHLFPERLDQEAPNGLYGFRPDPATTEFPLSLISPALASMITSTFGQLQKQVVPLEMHPEDASARRLAQGDVVRVFNAQGEVHTTLRVTTDVRLGTVFLPKGLWSHHTLNGANATALAPDTLSDLGQGACYNDARVEVARLVS